MSMHAMGSRWEEDFFIYLPGGGGDVCDGHDSCDDSDDAVCIWFVMETNDVV